ncbi:MAG TPA: TonB-dependent receptor [Myxococcaceae bacterium]|nr:TonB-dependent receptor [Myxococcaceae bacterium]
MRTCSAFLVLAIGAGASAAEPSDRADATSPKPPERVSTAPPAAAEPAPDATSSALSVDGDLLHAVPGTWGDPLRALARFPGATSVIGGMGPAVVRGRLPDATPTFFDGVRVSWPFHALVGPASFSPELIARADYYRGEAPARFGFLTGGAVDLHLPERVTGTTAFADVDLLTARGTVLSPVGPLGTRVMASAGVFWTPWLLSRATGGTVDANLADWQLSVAQPLATGELRLLWLGAYDGVALAQGEPESPPPGLPQYSFARPLSQMQRVDLRWRDASGLEASATYGLDRLALTAGGTVNDTVLEAAERTLRAQARWARAIASRGRPIQLELGAEVERRQADFELAAVTRPQAGDPGTTSEYRAQAVGVFAGAWAQVSGTNGPFTITPGLRLSTAHRGFREGTEVAFEPRVWIDYRGGEPFEVHGGAGWYHQPLTTLVPLPGFSLLHLPAGMSSVIQTTAGVTFHPLLGLDLGVDAYWDPMVRTLELPVLDPGVYGAVFADSATSGALVLSRATTGSALGVEFLLRKAVGDRLTGWLSYSVQRSARVDPALGKELPFAYEQTHAVNAVLAYRLPGGFTLSGAVLLRSGAPEVGSFFTSRTMREGTDVQGAPAWTPVPLDQVDRLPWLFRLDARASKAFDWDRLHMEVWLDVYDLDLQRDVVANSYGASMDAAGARTLTRGQTGLWYPLPMLGVRGAFRP